MSLWQNIKSKGWSIFDYCVKGVGLSSQSHATKLRAF